LLKSSIGCLGEGFLIGDGDLYFELFGLQFSLETSSGKVYRSRSS